MRHHRDDNGGKSAVQQLCVFRVVAAWRSNSQSGANLAIAAGSAST
jgi:hypothetical protein